MNQRTLYKAIEKMGSQHFGNDEEMLIAILKQILTYDRLNLVGGRIWKLHAEAKQYELAYEEGNIETVGPGFRMRLKDNPVFDEVAKKRTVLSDETNRILRKKGIIKYSATGIGEISVYGIIAGFQRIDRNGKVEIAVTVSGGTVILLNPF